VHNRRRLPSAIFAGWFCSGLYDAVTPRIYHSTAPPFYPSDVYVRLTESANNLEEGGALGSPLVQPLKQIQELDQIEKPDYAKRADDSGPIDD
jgi:hypothetical protein